MVSQGHWPRMTSKVHDAVCGQEKVVKEIKNASGSFRPRHLVGWPEKHFFGKCKVLMSQKLPYVTKALYTNFELDLCGVRMGTKSLKFWKYYWEAKK